MIDATVTSFGGVPPDVPSKTKRSEDKCDRTVDD